MERVNWPLHGSDPTFYVVANRQAARDHIETYEMITVHMIDLLLVFNRLKANTSDSRPSPPLRQIYLLILIEFLSFTRLVKQKIKRKSLSKLTPTLS